MPVLIVNSKLFIFIQYAIRIVESILNDYEEDCYKLFIFIQYNCIM